MDTTTTLQVLAQRILALGSPRPLASIQDDLRRGAGYDLRCLLDKYKKWAVGEGEAVEGTFVLGPVVRDNEGAVVAKLAIRGTKVSFTIRYEE